MADDENAQTASKDAFEVLHFIAAKRLAAGRLTVIDASKVDWDGVVALHVLRHSFTNCAFFLLTYSS